MQSSDEDMDEDDLGVRGVSDIRRIWDDDRAAGVRDEDDDLEDDMENFIDYDDEEENIGGMDEEEREERRRERRRLEKERRKALGSRPDVTGIDLKWVFNSDVFAPTHRSFSVLGKTFMRYLAMGTIMTGHYYAMKRRSITTSR